MSTLRSFDPDDVRIVSFDWSEFLRAGDSVDSATVVADPAAGVSVGSPSVTGDVVTAFVSTPGRYPGDFVKVTCHVVTVDGEEKDHTLTLKIEEH